MSFRGVEETKRERERERERERGFANAHRSENRLDICYTNAVLLVVQRKGVTQRKSSIDATASSTEAADRVAAPLPSVVVSGKENRKVDTRVEISELLVSELDVELDELDELDELEEDDEPDEGDEVVL